MLLSPIVGRLVRRLQGSSFLSLVVNCSHCSFQLQADNTRWRVFFRKLTKRFHFFAGPILTLVPGYFAHASLPTSDRQQNNRKGRRPKRAPSCIVRFRTLPVHSS